MLRRNSARRLLSEKLDRDFGRNFLDCFLNFLGRVCQPVGIDVDAHVARRTGHVLTRFQAADRLPEVAPAVGALKPELVGISASHGGMLSVWMSEPRTARAPSRLHRPHGGTARINRKCVGRHMRARLQPECTAVPLGLMRPSIHYGRFPHRMIGVPALYLRSASAASGLLQMQAGALTSADRFRDRIVLRDDGHENCD
jgi:hypothetical protein